ncbi:MAG: hypothetical protein DI566_03430 [Microbacterium sp.]|nr:MAG: hypothetical protein DI566_03430 [Microbacterium sp.]
MTDENTAPKAAQDTGSVEAEYAPAENDTTELSRDADVTFESFGEAFAAATDGPEAVDEDAPAQYGVGPFSVREVALGGIWLLAFIISFFPVYNVGQGGSVWTTGIDWALTIGVPTAAVFLLGLRRLSPQGIRRVGSLGIDQFASVAFTVSMTVWLGILWSSFVSLAGQRIFYATWVVWVEFFLMLAGVLLTVFAPLLPTVREDFRHRPEVPAHRFASPARPVVARPRVERPVAAAPAGPDYSPHAAPVYAQAAAPAYAQEAAPEYGPVYSTADDHSAFGPVAAVEPEPEPAPAVSQAFWALAPVERAIVDESGAPIFSIGPTAWALVIEDRGNVFVVRHEDGRIGYLTDVSAVTRG